MADFESIRIRNFKGAEDVKIDLSKRIESPVVTLIGLNESGKTTILEGLSYCVTGDNAVSSLFEGTLSAQETTKLIPVNKKAAFTDEISIEATVALSELDIAAITELAAEHRKKIVQKSFPTKFTVARSYSFVDSVLEDSSNNWDIGFSVQSGKLGKVKEYKSPTQDGTAGLWEEVCELIEGRLPRIAYFPTFLVDMPARIYLKEHKNERPVNRYYRIVFQDILNSIGENLTLEKHVTKRIEEFKAQQESPNWLSLLWGGPTKEPIDSVFQKIANAVTKEVLGSWQKVFQRPISAKNIIVEWNIDSEKEDLPYASFIVSDGESRYAISERSLGFRWFFSFLLFTAFKRASDRRTLFVFDEPAANLHAKAQAELLKSFSRIVADGHQIVYSTHSHHMINAHWLSGAYIVENAALDYDSDDAFGLTSKPTNIKATAYRHFIAQYPSRTSYFQPVIEKLEYVTPELLGSAPFVIVEGISDYYALSLAKKIANVETEFSLMPGVGAGASGPLIGMLLGRGDQFIVLLDNFGLSHCLNRPRCYDARVRPFDCA